MKTTKVFFLKSIYLFFFILVALLYSVWSAPATGKEVAPNKKPVRISLENLNLIDVQEVYETLDKLISGRGEFETKEEYQDRVVKQLRNAPIFNGDPDRYFDAIIDDVSFHYDIDKKEGTFYDPSLTKNFLPIKEDYESSTFVGQNAFGVEKEVRKTTATYWGIFCQNSSKDISNEKGWTKKMSVEEARAIKDNCCALVQFQITPDLHSDEPKVCLYSQDHSGATIDKPYETFIYSHGLFAQNVNMIFFNKKTGKIALIVNFATYQSQWSREYAQEKKEKRFKSFIEEQKEWLKERQEERRQEQIAEERKEKERLEEIAKEELKQKRLAEIEEMKKERVREAEEKKQKNEQKKRDYVKKAYFFFMDWKTPNGIINAKYVKMDGEDVVLENEKGKQIKVPLDSFDKQNRELLELAKCFKRVKSKLQKERVWTYANKKQYIESRKKSVPLTFRGTFVNATAEILLIKGVHGEDHIVHINELTPKDIMWVNKTYQVFLDQLREYEAKYHVRLLEPLEIDD